MSQSVQWIFDSALSHTRRPDPSEKREEKSVVALCTLWTKFACRQVSSPRLYRLIIDVGMKFDDNMEKYAVDVELKFPLKSILP